MTAVHRTTAAPPSATAAPGVPRVALGVVGLTLVGTALLGSLIFFDSSDYSEVAGGTVHLVHYALWTACLVALSQLFPTLGGMRGRDGRSVSPVVLRIAAVGAAVAACPTFVFTFVNPYLAEHAPVLLDNPPDGLVLMLPLLGGQAATMVGTATFAVAAALRRVVPVPAAVVLTLGALALPAIGPMSNLLVGAGLVWVAARGGSGSRVPA